MEKSKNYQIKRVMKKFFIFFLAAVSLLNLQSCEKSMAEEPQDEEYVELGLSPKGIDIAVLPMESKSSVDGVYCVHVRQGNKADVGVSYATWVTDDLSKEKIRLLKGYSYKVFVMYIPEAKKVLHSIENSAPFNGIHQICPGLKDGICYGDKYGNQLAMYGSARKKTDKYVYHANGYYFNDVDRYHGFVQVTATTNVTLDVNMYRQMFGLDITASNFTEGKLLIRCPLNEDSGNNDIIITPSNPSVSKVLEIIMMPWADSGISSEDDLKNYQSQIAFTIDYIDENNKSIQLLNFDEFIKRMTKIKITMDLKEILEDAEAVINPQMVNDEQWEEKKYEY